jgi:hypothetical protein
MPSPVGMPPGGQIWHAKDTGAVFVVYYAPGTDIPMLWYVGDPNDLPGLFGPGKPHTWDREFDRETDIARLGAVRAGVVGEIKNTTQDPFDGMVERFDREAQVRPALRDRGVRAAMAEAVIEGRPFTQQDLELTDWWRRSTAEQRAWEQLAASDPRTAQQRMESGRIQVRDAFYKAGYQNPTDQMINQFTQRWITGEITEVQLQDEIRRATDPYAPGSTRPVGTDVTALGGEEQVRQLVNQWLGPYYASGFNDQWVARWAGQIRNGGPGELDVLIDLLRNHKAALMPGTDPNTSYEDLAAPWRSVYARFAGALPDESKDTLFQQLLRNNDAQVNEQLLRVEGRKKGWAPVVDEITDAMQSAFGGQVLSGARG